MALSHARRTNSTYMYVAGRPVESLSNMHVHNYYSQVYV